MKNIVNNCYVLICIFWLVIEGLMENWFCQLCFTLSKLRRYSLTYLLSISPVTDNCSSWISGRGRMAIEMFSTVAVARSKACLLGTRAVPISIPTSGTFILGDLVIGGSNIIYDPQREGRSTFYAETACLLYLQCFDIFSMRIFYIVIAKKWPVTKLQNGCT